MKRKTFVPLIVVSLISSSTVLFFRCKPRDKTVYLQIDHKIIETSPHDTSFYTQGLTFYKGELYEGTGDPGYLGKSRLMKIDLKTGKRLRAISLSNKFFGEGITILRDTIYQLTWQQHKVFVYR
ncbi:MAG TPA: glutaminyl-peptide cyclotransferase [Chitinophagaceae bacterium]|jgi:glutamine cyclotransferase|nr:glutaminyl-peptide cyclotransferase [Chitinophagaceae bacterium]